MESFCNSKFSVLLSVSVLFISGSFGQPFDVTTVASSSATLIACSKASAWLVYSGTQTEFKIVAFNNIGTPSYFPLGQTKYAVNGTNLVVTNVSLTDGNTFACQSQTSPNDALANLVVLGQLSSPMVTPSTMLTPGMMVTITCTLTYAAPNNTVRPLAAGQDPQLSVLLGSTSIASTVVVTNGLKTATASLTITSGMAGQTLGCSVVSTAAGNTVALSNNSTLSMTYATNQTFTNLTINPNVLNFNVNVSTAVNCTANGFPLPTVRWLPVSSGQMNPSDSTRGQGWALLTLNKVGTNIMWNCTASNSSVAPPQFMATYTFTVSSTTSGVSPYRLTAAASSFYLAISIMVLFMLVKVPIRI